MPAQRQLSWSAAVRDMRNDRASAETRRAFIHAQHALKIEAIRAKGGADNRLWSAAGGFDRSAVMAYAVRNARAERRNRPGLTWAAAIAEMLRHAWACAHAARRAGSH